MTPEPRPPLRANTTTREATPRTTVQRAKNPASHDAETPPMGRSPGTAPEAGRTAHSGLKLTGREKILRSITEKQFQAQVEGLLKAYGWRYYHPPDNKPVTGNTGRTYIQNVKAGFPDLVAVRGGRLLCIELKRETGKTTPEQETWLADLQAAGAECHVWRPRDLPSIRATLAR